MRLTPENLAALRIRRDAGDIATMYFQDLMDTIDALTAERETGPCGKHPKMFWVGEQHVCAEDHECNQGVGCYPAYCTLCAERDAARGEALRSITNFIVGQLMDHEPTTGVWQEAIDIVSKAGASLDPSAVRAAEEQR